jgi:adenosylmethionine-8-amino-7-oxononanoate aminotransferase
MADSLASRDLDVLWHPCSQMRDYRDFPPLEVVSAQGSRLRLADGRELIDAIASWWCKGLGHGHPRLRAALVAQAEAFEHVILANTTNAPVVRLCERLLAAANGLGPRHWGPAAAPGRRPGHFGKVFFADNGSTGVEVALKMALQYQSQSGAPERTAFASLANGYHGETVGALAMGDCGLYKRPYASLLPPCAHLQGLPYRSGPDDPAWMDAGPEWPAIAAQLRPLAGTLAALVYEPVLQGAGGMRLYSPDLLRRLREWADAHGVLLIADEIAAGWGRLGPMLASHLGGAALPDLAVLSKGLTAGTLPMSAVLVPDRIQAAFDGEWAEGRAFLHSNTYAGNALAVAVANAVLDVYADEDVLGRVASCGPSLRAGLAGLARTRPQLRRVRGCGMMAAVDLTAADGRPLDAAARTGWQVYRAAVARGALLRPLGDTLYLFPPLTIAGDEVDRLLDIVAASVDAVLPPAGSARPGA